MGNSVYPTSQAKQFPSGNSVYNSDFSSEERDSLPHVPKNSYPLESDLEESKEISVPSLSFEQLPISVLSMEERGEELRDRGGSADHIYVSGARYIGSVSGGKRHGYGSMYWSVAVYYTGNWSEGMPKGEGTMVYNGQMFRGLWDDFQVTGFREVVEAGLQNLAEWLQAYNEGYCKHYIVWLWYVKQPSPELNLADLSKSQVLKMKMEAITLLLSQGEELYLQASNSSHFSRENGYFGTMKDGQPHGIGKKGFAGGCFYAGEWRNGALHGAGVYQWSAKKLRRAYFKQGQFDGPSILIENGIETLVTQNTNLPSYP